MFNCRKSLVCALSALALLSPLAVADARLAQSEGPECQVVDQCWVEHWYINGALGYAVGGTETRDIETWASERGFDVFDIDVDNKRVGYKLALGYAWSYRWRSELGFVSLGDVSAAFSTETTAPDDFFSSTADIHPTSLEGITASMRYTLFGKDEDYNVFARLGVLFWEGDYNSLDVFGDRLVTNDSSRSGTDVYLGLGASYRFDEDMEALIEWEAYPVDGETTHLLSVGLSYRF